MFLNEQNTAVVVPDLLYSLGEEAESLASALNVCMHLSTPFVVPKRSGAEHKEGMKPRGTINSGGQFYDMTSL